MTIMQLRRCLGKLTRQKYSKEQQELIKELVNKAYEKIAYEPPIGSLLWYATSERSKRQRKE